MRLRRHLGVVMFLAGASALANPVIASTDGTVDGSFGAAGAVILANEWDTTPYLGSRADVRFTPENSFIDSQGRILVAGSATPIVGGNQLGALLRISQSGVVDSSFGTEGLVTFQWGSGATVAYDVVESSAASGYMVYTLNGSLDDRLGPARDEPVVFLVGLDGTLNGSSATWWAKTPLRTGGNFKIRPVGMPTLADSSVSKFSIVTTGNSNGELIWNEFDSATGGLTGPSNDFIFADSGVGQVMAAAQTGSSGAEKFHTINSDFLSTELRTYDRSNTYAVTRTSLTSALSPISAYANGDIPLQMADGSVVLPLVDHRDTEGITGISSKVGLVKLSSSGVLDATFSSDGVVVVDGITASNAVGPTFVDLAEVPGASGGIAVSGTAANGNAQLTILAPDGTVRLAATELSSTECKGATKTIVANSAGEIFGFGVNGTNSSNFVMVKFATGGVAGSACGQVSAPGAPAITGTTAGDGQVSVAFTAPSSDGGATITNYEVSTNGGSTFTALSPASTTSPIVITGLTNGQQYTIQLKAVNSAGAGAASNSLAAFPSASSGSPGSGGGSGPAPSEPIGDVSAVLTADGVALTFEGLPGDVQAVKVRVMPIDFDSDLDSSPALSYNWYRFGTYSTDPTPQDADVPTVEGGVATVVVPHMTKQTNGSNSTINFEAGGEYHLVYLVVGAVSQEYPTGWRATNEDFMNGSEFVVVGTGSSSSDSSSDSGSDSGSSSDSSTTSTTVASGSSVPSLVTSSNQEAVSAPVGSAKLLVNGELVDVDLVQAPEELRRSVAGARTFAQVRALQTLAQDMVAAVQAVLGEGVTLPITVTNTETGATITGLVTDPVSGEPLAVPVEDVLLIVNQSIALMVGGADGTGDPANIAFDGVLEFGEGGYVAVLAYGLTPGAAGEVVVMSTPRLLDSFTVDTDGGVAVQAEIPSDLEAGEHTVVVAIDGQSASLGFRVLPEGTLPSTGQDGTPFPVAVLVLAVGGLAMLMVTRRRNTV